jgi:hypothetical protein
MTKKIFSCVLTLALLFVATMCFCQAATTTTTTTNTTDTSNTTQQNTTTPNTTTQTQPVAPKRFYEPYKVGEFPDWALDLRRGEIIMFGSFPFTFFFVTEGYDLYRFSMHGFEYQYAPWPFKDPVNGPYSIDEQVGVVFAALALSLVIAGTDYLIRKVFTEKSDNPPIKPDLMQKTEDQTNTENKTQDSQPQVPIPQDQGSK